MASCRAEALVYVYNTCIEYIHTHVHTCTEYMDMCVYYPHTGCTPIDYIHIYMYIKHCLQLKGTDVLSVHIHICMYI